MFLFSDLDTTENLYDMVIEGILPKETCRDNQNVLHQEKETVKDDS